MAATEEARSSGSRRSSLVQAAFHRIAERGFEGLRLRDVAEQVGIDHSTLHHYFPTKGDLIGGVVQHATRRFWPTMPDEGEPGVRLRGHLRALADMMQHQPELFVVLGELDLRSHRDAAMREVIDDHEAGWRTALTELFVGGVVGSVWSPGLEVAAAVELVIGTVKGVALAPDRAPAVLQQLADLLIQPGERPS